MTTFRPTFDTPFDQYADRRGHGFSVIDVIDTPDADHDAEVLPMYRIRFADGTEVEAWPEEVTEPGGDESDRQALANGFDSLTAAIRSGRCGRHPGFMRDNCPGCGTAAQIGDSA